jgi:ribosomal protein L22
VRAEAKWVRISPRKARLVADHIRGRSVPEARTVLAFTRRAAARELEKVLKSAVANAESNHGLIGDELLVSSATVDEGPTIKRWRARARGRVARIRKRTCHLTIRLKPAPAAPALAASDGKRAEQEQPKATRRRRTSEKPKAGQPGEKVDRKPTGAAQTSSSAKPEASQRKSKPKREAPEREAPKRATRTRKKTDEET